MTPVATAPSIERRERVIGALMEVVPAVIKLVAVDNACILATRVGIEALREFGIHAKPVAVKAVIVNRALEELSAGDFARMKEIRTTDPEYQRVGAYGVAVGFAYPDADTTHRYVGHLVMTTTNPDRLIDLTANQASRPQHDMPVEPAAFPMQRGALDTSMACFINHETGVVIRYEATGDLSYRVAADWREPTRRDDLVPPIVNAMRLLLDG